MSMRSSLRSLAVTFIVAVLLPVAVYAQTGLEGHLVPENCRGAGSAKTCGICDLAELAQNIVNTAIFLAVVLSAILFAWAGFKFLSNMSNPSVRGEASKIFWNVLVGLVIIMAAWLLVDTLFNAMTGNHLWSKVC